MKRRALGGPRLLSRILVLGVTGGLFSACHDGGPDGPGPVSATVTGPPMGAAVVEVRGSGITGFDGSGSSRVFSASTATGVYRVIVVGPAAGELPFQIMVQDRSEALPTGVVLSAVDGANQPFATISGFSLKVVR